MTAQNTATAATRAPAPPAGPSQAEPADVRPRIGQRVQRTGVAGNHSGNHAGAAHARCGGTRISRFQHRARDRSSTGRIRGRMARTWSQLPAELRVIPGHHRRDLPVETSATNEHLPGERLMNATRTGLRYARHAHELHAVLVRTVAFIGCASALWALLPQVARRELD